MRDLSVETVKEGPVKRPKHPLPRRRLAGTGGFRRLAHD